MSDSSKETKYIECVSDALLEMERVKDGKILTFNFTSTSDECHMQFPNKTHIMINEFADKLWFDFDVLLISEKNKFRLHVLTKFADLYASGSFSSDMRKNCLKLIHSIFQNL
ncbi:hypothetical protein [Novispirillum itersonii]|uniref:hypothetical protein n=1 Tax=Novispirillum itersonii TaxID=189 RepID=UPI001B7F7B27|nr:hypothetical protein [Novispirillum itersonii]